LRGSGSACGWRPLLPGTTVRVPTIVMVMAALFRVAFTGLSTGEAGMAGDGDSLSREVFPGMDAA
jgi:hypothetical protein